MSRSNLRQAAGFVTWSARDHQARLPGTCRWEAYPGACANTYGVAKGKGGGDRNEQASCYEAVFQAIESADFIQGMHIFVWNINRPGDEFPWIWTDPANQIRFSITEDEIAKWYHYFETP